MNTIKDLLQKVFEHDYEMSILKNKDKRMIRLKLKKDLANGFRIEQEMEITPEFMNSAEPKYTGYAVSEMFDKIIAYEKLKENESRPNRIEA